MKTSGVILEIGCEEIPARFVPHALREMKTRAETLLGKSAIAHGDLRAWGTPRRLALLIDTIAEKQEDRTREVTGPPRKAAYDKEGNLTRAAEGFAKSQGIPLDSLKIVTTEKGEYVGAVIEEKGRPVAEVLESLLPELILSIPFPKAMRWGAGTFRFVRPLHWIVALLDGRTIPFEVDGLKTGAASRGHRFLSPEPFDLTGPGEYAEMLEAASVIVDPERRRSRISQGCAELARAVGGRIVADEALLDHVVHLVEYPVPVIGSFEERYLSLPRELIINVMKGHQKYFALEKENGHLLPHFIAVTNTRVENAPVVVSGNERVLRARLEDARFYYEEDLKRKLEDRVEALKGVTYQVKLGSVYDKVERLTRVALSVNGLMNRVDEEGLRAACRLSKADLTTGVIYEFPELQGYMGRVYADHDGVEPEVARAVEEHYWPRFSGDEVPSSDLGAMVSLADKIDSVVAFFSVGLVPSGSEDPFALRRQALGILAILDRRGYDLSVSQLIDAAVAALPTGMVPDAGVTESVLTFFRQRFQGILSTEGHAYDNVEAILSAGFNSVGDVRRRLEALASLRGEDRFTDLVLAAKRVCNILIKAPACDLSEKLLKEPAEQELFKVLEGLEQEYTVDEFARIHELVPPINRFFDDVLVMDKDDAIKRNRFALLQRIRSLFERLADFSRIVE